MEENGFTPKKVASSLSRVEHIQATSEDIHRDEIKGGWEPLFAVPEEYFAKIEAPSQKEIENTSEAKNTYQNDKVQKRQKEKDTC